MHQNQPDRGLRRPLIAIAALATALAATPAFAQVRSVDGTGNNAANPDWGSTDIQLLRAGPVAYGDAVSSPAGGSRPNPRAISTTVFAQSGSIPSPIGASGFVFQWGQFLDHDIDLTEAASPPEVFSVSIPPGDPVFPPSATIPLLRSVFDTGTGTSAANPRQQVNQITAFIDASNVYGSDAVRAAALRKNNGSGELKTSVHDLLPFNTAGLPNAGGPDPELYLGGDVRANEQVGLTAMHVLFMREHNLQAKSIKQANSGFSDEQIYQAARARVGAILQSITYNEFLPVLLGPGALAPYAGYDNTVDPGIVNEFSTAAYRFGHSMISPVLFRLKKNGQAIPEGHLSLRDAFFTKNELNPNIGKGIEPLLRGLALIPSQAVDAFVVDDVRNFLFGDPSAGGVDLVALNIQRGRDHGLPSYNAMRVALGLTAAASFADVSSSTEVQGRLQAVYASVNDLDLWVAGLAEDKVPGALVGETFHAILLDQFERLRDGDSFWYQNVFSGSELAELEATTLSDVIVRNTKIKSNEIQANAFIVP